MVASVLPRVHSLVIGPGLGRDDAVLAAVARVIEHCKEKGTGTSTSFRAPISAVHLSPLWARTPNEAEPWGSGVNRASGRK